MKLVSWNVNGLRSAEEKFLEFVEVQQPDVLLLQEVRALPEELSLFLRMIPGYQVEFNPCDRPGYSGTAFYHRDSLTFDSLTSCVEDEMLDAEGRTIVGCMGDLAIVNLYTPNGSSGQERLDFKLRFYDSAGEYLKKLRQKGYRVILGADLNVGHTELDLYDPKVNANRSGFLELERKWFGQMLEAGMVDTFRLFEKAGGHYTWWHMRDLKREMNRGWRFDYFLVSSDLVPKVKSAKILRDVYGSDHCPILLEVDIDLI